MRILILGKDGMLGNALQTIFSDCDFVALNSKDLDITKKDDVFTHFMTIQPDVVINAAAYTDVDGAESAPDIVDIINGYAVGVLAKASREINAVFVHFSTDYVFDGQKRQGYKEDDKTAPINAYGRSKELGEKLVLEEMELQSWPNQVAGKYFLIRTSWLFGGHGENFVNTMLKTAQNILKKCSSSVGPSRSGTEIARATPERERVGLVSPVSELKINATEERSKLKKNNVEKCLPIEIVNDQFGKPTYALDLARQVRWLLESKEYPSGIYHIVNENVTNWCDFAKTIFNLAKLPVDVLPCSSARYALAAKRPEYSALVNTKLPPLRSWQEALEDYLGTIDN